MPQLKHACRPTAWCQLPINAVTDSGDSVTIPLSDSTPSTSASRQPTDETAANTLFLLDRFAVSDEFHHKLAQVHRCIIYQESDT